MAAGVNVHPLNTDPGYDPLVSLDRMAAANFKYVRADFGWSNIQPNSAAAFDGSAITSKIDPFFARARSLGIKVLAMIYKPPFWSSNAGTQSNPAKNGIPANAADYGNLLSWFINRYRTDLYAIEMFNEMDIATFSSSQSATDYVRIMKAGYAGGGGQGVPLIAGAATYLGLATGWLAAAYAVGGGGSAGLASGCGDWLGIHPYMSPSNVAPTGNASGSARKWSIVGIADVLALQAQNGDTKPLIATEFGWSAHANVGGEANYQLGVTDQQQADYLTAAYPMLRDLGVKGAFCYDDHRLSSGDAQEANFGIVRADGSLTPAYSALTALLA